MKYLAPLVTLLLITSFIIPVGHVHAAGATFVVNSLGDGPDANPGDGIAADASGACTLRAAIMEANFIPGTTDTIHFNIPGASSYTIKRENASQAWQIYPDQTVIDATHIRANGLTSFSEFALGEISTAVVWATRAPMPAPRYAQGVVTAGNGNIYAIGGWYGTAQSTVYEYNPITNIWNTKAHLLAPTSSAGVAAANGGKIYVIGGYPDGSTPIATVQEYNPATDSWSYKASMSAPRYTLAAATAGNGKIYAIGGANVNYGPGIATVEEYDPIANTWTTKSPMPTARRFLAAVAASNGKIYAIGGSSPTSVILATVEEYDPNTNIWTTKSPMSTPRFDPAAVAAPDGKIYVMGGYNNGPGSMATVEAYDPVTDTWTPQTSMPTQRHTFGAAVGNGKIYAIGGQTATGTEGLTAVVEEATLPTLVQYTLTINVSPVGGGSVSKTPNQSSFSEGTSVQLTATSAAGWQFFNWTGDVDNPNVASTTVTMNTDKTVTANFISLDNWPYRKTIDITGSSIDLTDYQVKVNVPFISGKMNIDFSDIRFTAADEATSLSYWLESSIASTSAIFWVKVPSIPTSGTTIYMYYGNTEAVTVSDFENTFLPTNNDFEVDAAGTAYDDISLWDHTSWKQNDAGTHGTVAVIEQLNTSATRFYSSAKSVYSWVQNVCTYDNNNADSKRSVQHLYTEDNYRVVVDSSTLSIWRTEVTYTNPSRWFWWFGVQLSDGLNTQDFLLYGRAWGNGEGVAGNYFNSSDLTATGADGQTWYRHSITIPSQFDKSNLTVKVYHVQDSWDHSTAESSLYYDLTGNFRLRQYVASEPVTAFVSEPINIANWQYFKNINISGSSSALTDYQVKVPVTFVNGKMNPDFSDILFTAANGTTLLNYWRESYSASTSAIFWIKVPSIPTTGTQIYMYYGNPAAESTSNGENTFIFFDDYSTNKLTQYTNQWLGGQANGRVVSIENGMLNNSNNGEGDEWFLFTKNGIQLANLAADIKLVSVSPKIVGKWQSHMLTLSPLQSTDANKVFLGYTHDNNGSPPYLVFGGGGYSNRTWDSNDGTGHTLTIAKAGNLFKALVDGEQYWSFTNDTLGAMSFYTGTYDCDNYLVPSTALYDDFRIRNYALPEPNPTTGAEEAIYPVLTMEFFGSGSIHPAAGTHSYNHGNIVSISATPAQGWQFLNWTGDTGTVGDVIAASTTVTMNAHYTITANFIQKAANWYSGWAYRKALVIDHTKVSNTDQSNFPVLISRTDNDWRTVVSGGHVEQTDGGDILFTASDGTMKLSHEIEKYLSSTGELIAWVKIPVLSASTNTVIYAYYGNAACADQWASDGSTWDANFKMVQHMEETTGTLTDSTSNANNGTPSGGVTQGTTGKVDGADVFDGSNDYIEIPHSASLNQSAAISVDLWVKAATSQSSPWFLVMDKSHGYTPDNTGWVSQGVTSTGKLGFGYVGGSASVDTGVSILDNTWHHICGTFDGTWIRMYVDGSLIQSGQTGPTMTTNTRPVEIGAAWGGGTKQRFFNGSMDEVRISDVARSADWVKTEYNNQSSPGTFYSSSAESAKPVPTPVHNTTTGKNFSTIQAAIDAADTLTGNTITVDAGTYTENVNVTKSVTISDNSNGVVTVVAASASVHVFNVTANNVTIRNLVVYGTSITSNKAGIMLNGVTGCVIENNICGKSSTEENDIGILLSQGSTNTIRNNVLIDNDEGIVLKGSDGNTISTNTIQYSKYNDIRLDYFSYPDGSDNNTISGNVCSDGDSSGSVGIYLQQSTGNQIFGNQIMYKLGGRGIELYISPNNIIKQNDINHIQGTYAIGLKIWTNNVSNPGGGNQVYLNNFADNEANVASQNCVDTWNTPAPLTYGYDNKAFTSLLGNYYKNYAGLDNGTGGRTANDGIGDTSIPVVTDGTGDNYPLKAAFTNYQAVVARTLTIGVSPAGSGVTSPVAGTYSYVDGFVVNISATANTGYYFVNWSGDVANTTSASTTVTMNANKTVTANFKQIPAPTLIALQITPVNPKVMMGTSVLFTATGIYSNGSRANLTTSVTWASSNPSVASIVANTGLATPVTVGMTTITATCSGIIASTNLTLTAAALQSIAIMPANPTISRGVAQQFTAIGTYSDASTDDITTSVEWTSFDQAKATIDANSGLVKSLAEGQTTISAALYGISGITILTVVPPTPSAVTIGAIKQNPAAYEGQVVKLNVTYRGWGGAYGLPPVGRSDFVIQDATGYMYVTGSSLGLVYPRDVGKAIEVTGIVRLKNRQPYVEI